MIVGCPPSIVNRALCVVRRQQLLQMTSPHKLLAGFFIKLGRNYPYIALFKNSSNGFGPLHIKAKIDFLDET